MIVCPSCARENPDGAKFCMDCGEKLETSAIREERKVVTIVFCDLAGFTKRSETLDPEDVRHFLLPYYDLMTEEVERHGGVIDKLYGDGAMAVFGAPVAHEDDPERAIRASLRVLERLPALGLQLQARIGISTGEVVVSADHAQRGDALTGDTVNTASRIQAAAPVGGVVVGESTHAATAHVFEYEVLPPVQLKGKAGRVPIYRPHTPIGHVGATLASDASPFVGRQAELGELIEAFERAREAAQPTFVTIIADAGIGKSRLVREFARYIEDLPDLITWRQGRCLPYGEGISFWALGEIVKSHAGILDTDGQVALSAKLDIVLTESDPNTRSWVKDRLAPLVGLETTTQPPGKDELFTAWRRFVGSIAADGPLVLVIEDLHWADDALIEFLEHLRTSMADVPVLTLVTARPEVSERHPSWLADPSGSKLRLRALADSDMRELVAAMFEGPPPGFIETVLERAGGSPLYTEQLSAMRKGHDLPIAGGSTDDLPIPPTVQALLAARIDLLPPDLKDVLLDASVIGKTFWAGAVAALASLPPEEVAGRLGELQARELIRSEAPSSIQGEAEFAFVHALVRDVAYGRLSRRSRLTKHRDAAAWIAERVGRPLGDVAEIVVSHLDRAREAAVAAGLAEDVAAIAPALVDALLDAGEHAKRTDVRVAIRLFDRALELLPEGDRRRPYVLASVAASVRASGDFTRAAPLLERSIAGLRALGDYDALGEQFVHYSVVLAVTGGDPVAFLQGASEELGPHPGPGLIAVLTELALLGAMYENVAEARRKIERAKTVVDRFAAPMPVHLLEAQGMVTMSDGDPEGWTYMRRAFQRALEQGSIADASDLLHDMAVGTAPRVGYQAALDAEAEAISFAEEHGLDRSAQSGYLIRFLYHLGRWDDALDEAPPLIEQLLAQGDVTDASTVEAFRTMIRLERGGAHLEQIEEDMLRPEPGGSPSVVVRQATLRLLFRLSLDRQLDFEPFERTIAEEGEPLRPFPQALDALIRAGRPDLAEKIADRWLGENSTSYTLSFAQARALLAEGSGDPVGARPLFERALELARTLGSKRDEADVLLHLGRWALAVGEKDDAITSLQASRVLWEQMEANAFIAEIDEVLATL